MLDGACRKGDLDPAPEGAWQVLLRMAFLAGPGECSPDVSGTRCGAAAASSAAGMGQGGVAGRICEDGQSHVNEAVVTVSAVPAQHLEGPGAGGACPCMAPPPPVAARLARPRMHPDGTARHGSLQSNLPTYR